jgi:hypothetical protein
MERNHREHRTNRKPAQLSKNCEFRLTSPHDNQGRLLQIRLGSADDFPHKTTVGQNARLSRAKQTSDACQGNHPLQRNQRNSSMKISPAWP